MAEHAVLVVKEGPLAGRRIELEAELVLGREGAGLTIDDAEISRRHAAVRLVGDRVEVEDLGSLNGTFVNGRRIESATALGTGDVVRLGHTLFEIEPVTDAGHTVLSTPRPGARATQQQPRPAAPPSAPPAPVPVSAPPQANLGAFAPAASKRRGRTATRRLTPTLLSFAGIAATAVALVVYFAQH
jgi:pSer/pThr/pTyr-binding forkhead associated (FHA) protein